MTSKPSRLPEVYLFVRGQYRKRGLGSWCATYILHNPNTSAIAVRHLSEKLDSVSPETAQIAALARGIENIVGLCKICIYSDYKHTRRLVTGLSRYGQLDPKLSGLRTPKNNDLWDKLAWMVQVRNIAYASHLGTLIKVNRKRRALEKKKRRFRAPVPCQK